MDRLYVLQYDDDPYCAPYCKEIFTSKNRALKYIQDNDLDDFRCMTVYEYDNRIKGYLEQYDLYYLDKSHWDESVRHFWEGFDDKNFISSSDFYDITDKMR